MGRFIFSRIVQGLVVILGVTLIVFVVTRMIGDPVKVMLPLESTLEQRAAFEKQLGLDRPIAVQFVDFMGDIVRLDFGDSLWQHRPAMTIVFEKLPLTILLTAVSIGLACVFAIPLGIIAALRPGGVVDRTTVFVSLLGLSVPQFWLGLLFIVIFAVHLRILPTSGAATPQHIIMPAMTMALPALARLVMLVRSSMIDELNQQYVKTSFAKGLPVVIMEAMALRRPVLTTFIAGIPELVRDNENGWLFPAGSVDDLSCAIKECLSSSVENLIRMGDNGHERVIKRHNIETETAKLIELFRE